MIKEWKRDSKDEETISKETLFDSLFELVDIWTPEADKEQYTCFYELLKLKILLEREEDEDFLKNKFIDVYDIT